jgi:hypothetical protein
MSPAAQQAVTEAKQRTLARVEPGNLPRAEAERVALATTQASVSAFHAGIGIAAGLVAVGGILGLVGIRNPRREVPCADCPGGTFAGAPLDAGRTRVPELPRAQPEPHAA